MNEIATRRILARSTIAERLKALAGRAVPFKVIAGDLYAIGGDFVYYPSTGFWRGRGAQGYTLAGLIQAYEALGPIPEAQVIEPEKVSLPPPLATELSEAELKVQAAADKPAGGRDSVKQAENDPDNRLTLPVESVVSQLPPQTQIPDNAESPAGTTLLSQNKWP